MGISRTETLILSFLRSNAGEPETSPFAALSDSDWQVLIEESGRQSVIPLIYGRLISFPPDFPVPDWVKQRLRLLYLKNAGRNLLLYEALGEIGEVLAKNNIPVMALKGAHLAQQVYETIALRPMCDLDLLVKEKDLDKVDETLLGLGYRPIEGDRKVTKKNHHFVYLSPRKEFGVEIHWNLIGAVYPFDIDLEGQWERARLAVIGKSEFFIQAPEDLLLHLCLHNCKDLFENGLKLLCDLTETIRHYERELEWEQVLLRSRQWGINKFVYIVLSLAAEGLKASVPGDLLKAMRPNDFEESYKNMGMAMLFGKRIQDPDALFFTNNMAHIWGHGRFSDKIILFFRRVFPSSELMARIYPEISGSLKVYFYYPKRLIDILRGHRRQVWRLFRRDEKMMALAEEKNKLAPLMDWLDWPE
jgi:hypothetical protein